MVQVSLRLRWRRDTDGVVKDQNAGAVDPGKIEMAMAELDMITDVL